MVKCRDNKRFKTRIAVFVAAFCSGCAVSHASSYLYQTPFETVDRVGRIFTQNILTHKQNFSQILLQNIPLAPSFLVQEDLDEELQGELEDEVEGELEEEVEGELEEEVEGELEEEVEGELEEEVEGELEEEVEGELEEEVEGELEEEVEGELEEEVEGELEEEVEGELEEEVEGELEEEVEGELEEEVEGELEEEVEGELEEEVEGELEDEVEGEFEEELETEFEEELETEFEEELEGEFEQELEGEFEQELEGEFEEELEGEFEEELEGEFEEELEGEFEEELEGEFEEELEGEFEEELEGDFEQELEGQFEAELEGEFEQELKGDFDEELEGQFEEELEDEFEEELEGEYEEELEGEFEENLDGEFEEGPEGEFDEGLDEGLDSELDEEIEAGELENEDAEYAEDDEFSDSGDSQFEENEIWEDKSDALEMLEISEQIEDEAEQEILIASISEDEKAMSNFWLVLGNETELADLQNQGFSVSNRQKLSGLNLTMARIQAPKTFNMAQNNLMVLNNTGVMADYNHIYTIAADTETLGDEDPKPVDKPTASNLVPSDLLALASESSSHNLGIIDTAINRQHPSLKNAEIHYLPLSKDTSTDIAQHGTAVASIIVGKDENYQGLRPQDPLWAASVFFSHKKEGTVTTTELLIRAMDWLVKNQVSVINMSLSGPANRLLESVTNSLCERGITIVAAVGNDGPNAGPQYPAAYDCTLAVTAINKKHRVFRNAVRGQHVDVAAYGVNLLHADHDGGLSSSSGTSFATPLVSAYFAAHAPGQKSAQSQWLKAFYQRCLDIGQPGWDPIYGHGLMPSESFTIALESAD